MTQSLLLTAFAGVLSCLAAPFIGGIDFQGATHLWLPILLMIVAQAFGNVFFFKGLETTEASTAQVTFSSILIWSVLLSLIILKSTYSYLQIIGMVVMMVAILFVQYQKGSIKINAGSFSILFSALLFAFFQIFSAKVSQELSVGTYLVLAYLGPTLLIGTLYFSSIRKDLAKLWNQLRHTFLLTIFASGTSLGYFAFSFLAYRFAPDRGVVVVLLTAQVVFSVLLAVVFLHERIQLKKKIIAGILAFIASVLIKA